MEGQDEWLLDHEEFWRDHYEFLARRGYRLRSRFEPNHVPLRFLGAKRRWYQLDVLEDEVRTLYPAVIDAVRTDGSRCVLRRTRTWTDEIPAMRHLLQLEHDERNRVVPILDVVLLPDDDEEALLVMPLLRLFYDPPFSRVSEVIDAVRQLMQCMQLLHEHHIAHRDFCALNLMMDASRLIPGGFHFSAPWGPPDAATHGLKYHDRSKVAPMKYYLIDFGLCSMLPDKHSRVTGVYGQDKTVPELSWDTPYDPFKVDIYQFGNVLRQTLIGSYYDGLNFLAPLAGMMTRPSPDERPDIDEALRVFEDLVSSLPDAEYSRRLHRDGQRHPVHASRVRCCSLPCGQF